MENNGKTIKRSYRIPLELDAAIGRLCSADREMSRIVAMLIERGLESMRRRR